MGLGCAIAECIASCIVLGAGDWADATTGMLPSKTATVAAGMYFIEMASRKEWMKKCDYRASVEPWAP